MFRALPGPWCALFMAVCIWLTACDSGREEQAAKPAGVLADELILYDWVDDMPRSVLDAFTREYGVKIRYVTFESQEEAVESIQKGNVYDVAVIENPFIPALVETHRLTAINYGNVPNFRNISPNFRDLAADPGNRYTVPYHYGTTALLVRTDLVKKPVTRFADLWNPQYAGKIAVRAQPRELIAVTLLSLGYDLNSENPAEIDAAVSRLLELKKTVQFVDVDTPAAVSKLLNGEAVILLGWPMDYQVAHAANKAIAYVLPEEGTALWSDNYVIPASCAKAYTAEIFINFLLRPEISAQMIQEKSYPNANETACFLVKPEISNDPVIFPSTETLRRAHFYLPLSTAGSLLYRQGWERFLAGPQPAANR